MAIKITACENVTANGNKISGSYINGVGEWECSCGHKWRSTDPNAMNHCQKCEKEKE